MVKWGGNEAGRNKTGNVKTRDQGEREKGEKREANSRKEIGLDFKGAATSVEKEMAFAQ